MTSDEIDSKLKEQENNLKAAQLAVIKLAEMVKELVRITQGMPKFDGLDQILKDRLEDVYHKAVIVKHWMPNETNLY